MVQQHNSLADGQPQTGAGDLARHRAIHLSEFFKDQLLMFRPDPDAIILHGKQEVLGPIHLAGSDDRATWRGELVGIAEQVDQNLFQTHAVCC